MNLRSVCALLSVIGVSGCGLVQMQTNTLGDDSSTAAPTPELAEWARACHGSYEKVRAESDRKRAETKQKVDQAKALSNPYDRLRALLALPYRSESDQGPAERAAAYDTELAIARGFRDAGVPFAYFALHRGNRAVSILPPFDEPTQRDAFCTQVQDLGSAEWNVPASPGRGQSHLGPERTQQLEELTRARRTAPHPLSLVLAEMEKMSNANVEPTAGHGEVTSFEIAGGKAKVVLTEYSKRDTNMAGPAHHCENNLGVHVPCPKYIVATTSIETITFDAWPSDLVLEQGDSLVYFGVPGEARTTASEKSPGGHNEKIEREVAGLHLVSFTKSGKTVETLE